MTKERDILSKKKKTTIKKIYESSSKKDEQTKQKNTPKIEINKKNESFNEKI
jgi:hypothetical protein